MRIGLCQRLPAAVCPAPGIFEEKRSNSSAEDGMNTEQKRNKEITIGDLWSALTKNILWILLFTLIIAVAMGIYTKVFQHTTYKCTLVYQVQNLPNSTQAISTSYIGGASQMADNCMECVKMESTLKKIVDKGSLQTMFDKSEAASVRYLRNNVITTSHEDNTIFFYVTIEYKTPEETVAIANATRETLGVELEQMRAEKDAGEEQVRVFDTIFPNSVAEISCFSMNDVVAVNPPLVKNVTIAAVLAFLVAYVVFFIFAVIDKLIYDEKTVKDNFSYPVIGSIPTWQVPGEKRRERNIVEKLLRRPRNLDLEIEHRNYNQKLMNATTPFAITEAFNLLRTNLSYSRKDGTTPVYAMVSAFAGVGKSLVISNLAISFANMGKKTLLVEGDMRLPVFYRIFGTDKNAPGLSELLAGIETDYRRVANGDVAANLDVISSGRIPPNPSELLAQPAMETLIAQWREDYDIVLVDMPPIGEVADAGVIAKWVTGYILTLRTEYSDIDSVDKMIADLENVNAPITGFVLNDVSPKAGGKYYKKSSYYHTSNTTQTTKA